MDPRIMRRACYSVEILSVDESVKNGQRFVESMKFGCCSAKISNLA
jgi:hypothetical protein